MTTLPSDLDVARRLVTVRAAVIESTHHVRSPKRSTRYRTTRNLIIAAAAIAALTGGAIVAIQAAQATIATNAWCYHDATLDSDPMVVIGDDGSTDDPYDLCAVIWRSDLWDPANNNADPNAGTNPVPDMVACELPDGVVGVFPRDGSAASTEDFCEALGLADWGSD